MRFLLSLAVFLMVLPGVKLYGVEGAPHGQEEQMSLEAARRILDDPLMDDVLARAKALLKTGLNAGSGYGEVWIRDLNTFIDLALEVNDPAPIREGLLTFLRFQGPEGDIVDGFIPRDRAGVGYKYRESEYAPGLLAHKNTVETDQESSWVQAVRKYVEKTGDRSFLGEKVGERTVQEGLNGALSYLLNHRMDAETGLIWGATTADWGDVQPEHEWGVELDENSHRAIDIYDNAMFLIAIRDYLNLVGPEAADRPKWLSIDAKLREKVKTLLWDEENQKFRPHLYLEGSPFDPAFDENEVFYHGGTAIAIEADLLTRKQIQAVLEKMRENVRSAGAATIGLTLYPPYPDGSFKNRSMGEYSYQNGGDWTWFGGRMIQQLIEHGMIEDACTELRPMLERVEKHDGFFEWWTRDNRPRGSGHFRGSAGVLGQCIEMLRSRASQRLAAENFDENNRPIRSDRDGL
jgi:hypothetical protein